ncbi:MAG: hypothetical protein NZM07_05540 [Elioraea sp.]|nr:hypothetical protein [Elioraea sp.]
MQHTGAIGNVEYACAKLNRLVSSQLQKRGGNFVVPSGASFQAAADNAEWSSAPYYGISLNDTPDNDSWPITAPHLHPRSLRCRRPAADAQSAALLRLRVPQRRQDRGRARVHHVAGQHEEQDPTDVGRQVKLSQRLDWKAESAAAADWPRPAMRGLSDGKAIEDRAVQQSVAAAEAAVIGAPSRQVRLGCVGDAVFSGLATASGIFIFPFLGGIAVELFLGRLGAFETFGIRFL